VQPKARRAHLPEVSSHTWRLVLPSAPPHARVTRAHAARDPSDTISDYKFTPGSLTIHVGDTVTWTNDGPSAHTATANDHSFDTGILQKAQSGSHTFSQAGTFAYFCTIHPFMHGTIVVLAASTSSTTPNQSSNNSNNSNNSSGSGTSGTSGSGSGSSGSSSSSSSNSSNTGGTSASSSSGSSGSTLPLTGLSLITTLGWAAGLIAVGVALRRRSRA
jgi:plastocyanin